MGNGKRNFIALLMVFFFLSLTGSSPKVFANKATKQTTADFILANFNGELNKAD